MLIVFGPFELHFEHAVYSINNSHNSSEANPILGMRPCFAVYVDMLHAGSWLVFQLKLEILTQSRASICGPPSIVTIFCNA
jgi:hypothetical protein